MSSTPHFDCPKCGKRYYDAQRFCVDCGLDFRAAFRRCPRCKQDTPRESERCINCDYDLVAYDIRRPKYIVLLALVIIVILLLTIPYLWFHTPIGKRHGEIISGEMFINSPGDNDYVPMFYEYQSGTRAIHKAKEGGWRGMSMGMDASRLLPLPPPTIPYENVSMGERVYVTSKARDADGNMWYHIRRYRKDVVRQGWVHESNIKFG